MNKLEQKLWLYKQIGEKLPLFPSLEKGVDAFEWNWIHFTQDAVCQAWLKLSQEFWRRRFLIVHGHISLLS